MTAIINFKTFSKGFTKKSYYHNDAVRLNFTGDTENLNTL